MLIHRDISIKGKVQNVGFRYRAVDCAHMFRVTGFVRNETDGSVYAEVEGEEAAVESFIKWCAGGPPHARIGKIAVQEGPLKHFVRFAIEEEYNRGC